MNAVDAYHILSKHMLMDRMDLLMDLERSQGCWLYDAQRGERFLDCYTGFASIPIGYNHPRMTTPDFLMKLGRAAVNKPALSDTFTREYAEFVDAFYRHALPESLPYLFTISGGSLANENALKTAFDWKVRKNLAAGRPALGSQAIHFRQAFHGRTGYTIGITDSPDPRKTLYFPKFSWPRIDNPKLRFPRDAHEEERVSRAEQAAIQQIEQAFAHHPHDIAAILIEPIQGEGGDNHFRGEFLASLRRLADEHEALLIFDEVQTGTGTTGKWWAHQHFQVQPDILVFGKKTQICGIAAGRRLDEVDGHVFRTSSRINSTWGGDLTDAVRFTEYLKLIVEEEMVENAARVGSFLVEGLTSLASQRDSISNARGRGMFIAFDAPDASTRSTIIQRAFDARLLILACGERSIRLRPALNFPREQAAQVLDILDHATRL